MWCPRRCSRPFPVRICVRWVEEGKATEGEEPPVLAPRGHGRCGARRSAARFGAAGRGPGEAHVRRPDVPRRAPAEGASAPVQSGGCGVPGRRGAYDRCRGHHHAHALLREGGHPARFHAPSVELHGLRAVPSGLPRARARLHGRARRRAVRHLHDARRGEPAAGVRLQEPPVRGHYG